MLNPNHLLAVFKQNIVSTSFCKHSTVWKFGINCFNGFSEAEKKYFDCGFTIFTLDTHV